MGRGIKIYHCCQNKKRRGIIIYNIEKETKLEINWRIICASAIQENENRSRLMHLQLNFKFNFYALVILGLLHLNCVLNHGHSWFGLFISFLALGWVYKTNPLVIIILQSIIIFTCFSLCELFSVWCSFACSSITLHQIVSKPKPSLVWYFSPDYYSPPSATT